jgi:hypothetical protein
MTGLEPVLGSAADLVVVVGDVNSTLASALTSSKCGIRVAHVEAGLRSFDRTMPEEINRVVTDALSDVLLAPSPDAVRNLLAEGHPETSVHQVGNVMIDSLRACMVGRRDPALVPGRGDTVLVATSSRVNVVGGGPAPRRSALESGLIRSRPLRGAPEDSAGDRTRRRAGAGEGSRPRPSVLDFLWLIANATAVLTIRAGSGGDHGPRCSVPTSGRPDARCGHQGTTVTASTGRDPPGARRASSSARGPGSGAVGRACCERVVDVFNRLA